jgi:uncharacterized ion transporter superfamily protein YfcC
MSAEPSWRRWLPTVLQFRLTLLVLALIVGITGMSRNDQRMVYAAMGFGAVGIILRFVAKAKNKEPSQAP